MASPQTGSQGQIAPQGLFIAPPRTEDDIENTLNNLAKSLSAGIVDRDQVQTVLADKFGDRALGVFKADGTLATPFLRKLLTEERTATLAQDLHPAPARKGGPARTFDPAGRVDFEGLGALLSRSLIAAAQGQSGPQFDLVQSERQVDRATDQILRAQAIGRLDRDGLRTTLQARFGDEGDSAFQADGTLNRPGLRRLLSFERNAQLGAALTDQFGPGAGDGVVGAGGHLDFGALHALFRTDADNPDRPPHGRLYDLHA